MTDKGFMRVETSLGFETWPIRDIRLSGGRILLEIRREAGEACSIDKEVVFTIFGEDGRGICQRTWTSGSYFVGADQTLNFTYSLTIAEFLTAEAKI